MLCIGQTNTLDQAGKCQNVLCQKTALHLVPDPTAKNATEIFMLARRDQAMIVARKSHQISNAKGRGKVAKPLLQTLGRITVPICRADAQMWVSGLAGKLGTQGGQRAKITAILSQQNGTRQGIRGIQIVQQLG